MTNEEHEYMIDKKRLLNIYNEDVNPNESQCEVSMYEEDPSSQSDSGHEDNYIQSCGFEMKLPLETILEQPRFEDEAPYAPIRMSSNVEQTVQDINDTDYTIDRISKAALWLTHIQTT